ncbi:MAG: hypothetical protein ACK4WD_07440 [Flavobacteriales bacterium]
MWKHHFEQETQVPLESLWQVLANVQGWVNIDKNIDKLVINESPKKGTRFTLKPKGGPTLKFEIETFIPPYQYADLCKMPGAAMKTLHTLQRIDEKTTIINVDIEILGPMSWLWGLTVGKKHAAGLPAQTKEFIKAAESMK